MQEIKIGSIIIYYDSLLLILRLKTSCMTYKQYNQFKQTITGNAIRYFAYTKQYVSIIYLVSNKMWS